MRRPPPVPHADIGQLVLLAVDDDEPRLPLARKHPPAGHNVIEGVTGVDMHELIVEHALTPQADGRRTASLVISDVRMPDWSGLAVLRVVRRADVSLPIVLMTAFGDAATHAEARALGASAIYDKPIDLDVLVEAAKTFMAT